MFPETLIPGNLSIALQFFLAVGVALAAKLPLGAISILTIQRAMSLGFWRAFRPPKWFGLTFLVDHQIELISTSTDRKPKNLPHEPDFDLLKPLETL